jgi:multiple sugar transport system ATP-binding protein
MAQLSLRNIHQNFAGNEILKDISLDIADQEFVVFVGPSGSGKSTLLRVIAGLDAAASGQIFLNDKDITHLAPGSRDLAMVFQSYALYPHMSVKKNLSFALQLAKLPAAEIEQKVAQVAQMLDITHLLERKPKALSGGQRQRVAIGRAMVRSPQIFLLDEPLSNLDAALRQHMRLELANLHRKLGATMIYVTHDQVEAMTLADKMVVLNHGRIEQIGTPHAIYFRPHNRFVAGFLGTPAMNFFDIEKTSEQALQLACGVTLPFAVQQLSQQPALLGIRPEALKILPAAVTSGLRCTVEWLEHLGNESLCHLQTPQGQRLVIRSSAEFDCKIDQSLSVALDPSRVHLFNAEGIAIYHAPHTAPQSLAD